MRNHFFTFLKLKLIYSTFFLLRSLFISMGRKQKYITNDEKLIARRERQMRYYWKNQEEIKEKNLKRYYVKKLNN